MIKLYTLYIIYTYLCTVCNQRMLLSTSTPGVFQPLSSSQSLPHCGICPKTQDSLFSVKKAHFVMSNLCSVQDSDEQAAAYGFAGLTYSLRSRAPRHNPAPCMQYLVKTIRFKHKWAFCQTCLSNKRNRSLISFFFKRKCKSRLVCRLLILPSLFGFQSPNTKSCLFGQTAWTACYFCSTGTKLAPRALSHHQP